MAGTGCTVVMNNAIFHANTSANTNQGRWKQLAMADDDGIGGVSFPDHGGLSTATPAEDIPARTAAPSAGFFRWTKFGTLCKVCRMAATPILQPTLWRTCRVLANHTRLQILELLVEQQPRTVSAVAAKLHLTLPVASQALRALEARSLLTSSRVGRRVEYRLGPGPNSESGPTLVTTVRAMLQRDAAGKESIFKLATAFTHPRRIEVFRLLQSEPRPLAQLQAASRISLRALFRHLRKLEVRGFLVRGGEKYSMVSHSHPLGRELARLATNQ